MVVWKHRYYGMVRMVRVVIIAAPNRWWYGNTDIVE